MGASDLRDSFNAISLPSGVRCIAVRLTYCDANGTAQGPRTYQIVSFDLVKAADNSKQTVTSDPIPPGANLLQAVQALAQKAIS